MRVLYLHQYFVTPSHAGGTRSYEFARRLVEMGHEVHVVTTSAFLDPSWTAGSGWNVRHVEGVHVHVMGSRYSNRMGHASRVREFLGFAIGGWLRARRIEADVVFASSTPLTVSIPGILTARAQRIPFVFEVRDLWPDVPIAMGVLRNRLFRTLARWLEHWAYRNATRIVALSPDMADGIARQGVERGTVTVIPNGCDLEAFTVAARRIEEIKSSFSWWGERRVVLYAGTLGVVNQVEFLVEIAAVAAVRSPELRFVVVGDGVRRESVTGLAAECGVLDRNFFVLDPVPKHEVAGLVAAADMAVSLVAPVEALWANSANKVFDALAAGTPVAVNHGGWIAEFLEEANCGIVLHGADATSAAESIIALLEDPGRCIAMGEAARRVAVQRFSRNELAAQLESVLLEAVESGKHRR